MIVKFVFSNLQNSMILYLFELRHRLNCYINPHGDFFDRIKSSHRYFDHKMFMYQLDIIKIVV